MTEGNRLYRQWPTCQDCERPSKTLRYRDGRWTCRYSEDCKPLDSD